MPNWSEIGSGLKHAWNAFRGRDRPYGDSQYFGGSYSRPDRRRMYGGNEQSIVTAIQCRIALDVAAVAIHHVRLDQNGRYVSTIDSGLENVLNTEANIDQTGRAFIQDLVISMFDEGCVAALPVDTSIDPWVTNSFDILTMRSAKVTQWYPETVELEVYNDRTGLHERLIVPKKTVAIIENPLYAVMNEHNSTFQRLRRKLSLLDIIDEQSSSGKLDMIIQLPYPIRSELKKKEAEARRRDIEDQLTGTKYGIAYTGATEKIVQLNRPIENNLLNQIEYLTNMLYSQLGLTPQVLDGTANETVMLNYYNRTIEPILAAITDEFRRKFLTKTARTQRQSIIFTRDPFKLVPVNNIADIADKFTRNEILSSNELRAIIGFKPVDDTRADELRNKNLNQNTDAEQGPVTREEEDDGTGIV